ncbi:MAG: FAD-dependent monooxygenase [Pseudonocardiaceae bacterium]
MHGTEMLGAFPLPGQDLWRLMAPAPGGTDGNLSPQEVLNLLTGQLHERTGCPLSAVHEAQWTSTFRIHRRLAQHYRQGRMLVAGDAAHVHSPFGGQGMNTGIGDAENLAWKLALVVHGHADPALLDSYQAERRPIATEVLQSTGALTGVVLGDTRPARLLRDHLFVPSLNLPVVQRLIWEHASQLKISYRHGPLAGTRDWPLRTGPRPGDRVPDQTCLRLDGNRTRLHAELGSHWVLLTPANTSAHAQACADRARDRLGLDAVIVVTPHAGRPPHVVLIRPDGHVGLVRPTVAHSARRLAHRHPAAQPDRRDHWLMTGSHIGSHSGGLRERKKAETRRRIQEHALRLFLSKGYDSTTVQEVAAAAGVSHMTFFRYFQTKEAVVENDDYDPLIVELISRRPPEEEPLIALHRALSEGLARIYDTDQDVLLTRTKLVFGTPALRARMADNQYATERLFTESLAARVQTDATLELQVQAAAALAALTVALSAWAESDGADHLPTLVDRAFHALAPTPRGTNDGQ